jgi:hypothetical protein
MVLQRAAEGAAILLLFSSLVSAWAIAVVSGGAIAGLIVYALVARRDPERYRIVGLALAAACAGALIAGGLAALSSW